MTSLQKIKDRDQFGVTFADPALPNNTTRTKHTSKPKTLNGIVLDNNVFEVVALRSASIPGAVDGNAETLSVRIKISGSSKNATALKDLTSDVMKATLIWLDEDVLVGFDPVTPPDYDQ